MCIMPSETASGPTRRRWEVSIHSLKGLVATVQTERLLRFSTKPLTAAENDSFCFIFLADECCGSRS